MVIKEFLKTREDGVNLYKSYSDQNMMLRKVGTDEVYASAVDIDGAPYQYEETSTPVPVREPSAWELARRAAEKSTPEASTI